MSVVKSNLEAAGVFVSDRVMHLAGSLFREAKFRA
jgi:hypothetical protein